MNKIHIWHETFGNKKDPAILLIMGGCCQGVLWPTVFCKKLSREGFYVIRYDHRDAGLSTGIDFEKHPYDLMDMAKDALELLDTLGIKKAQLFGISMGGLIAQLLAAYFPERVHSILVLGSSSEIRPMNRAYAGLPPEKTAKLPPPLPRYVAWLQEFLKIAPQTDEEKLAQRIEGWNQLNGDKIPLDKTINREIHQAFLKRLSYPNGIVNHVVMLRGESSENWVRSASAKIKVPTVILQGSEDPIFPPDHGKALAQAIKNSEYIFVEGMGHIPSDHFFDLYIEILLRQAQLK
jgi:pimeloyl-ACP methyl ester carboxylesterase